MIKVITPPTNEPVSFEEAAMHLRLSTVPSADSPTEEIYIDEALVRLQITAAREYCEQFMGRSVSQQTVEFALSGFSLSAVEFPFAPVMSVVSVVYTDGDGVEQTLPASSYVVDTWTDPATFYLAAGETWPTTQIGNNASVRVRYVAGHGVVGESPLIYPVPAAIKQAILLLVGFWYENREAVNIGNITSTLEFAVRALLTPYRYRKAMA